MFTVKVMQVCIVFGFLAAVGLADDDMELSTTNLDLGMDSMEDLTTTVSSLMETCDCPVNNLLSTMTELLKDLTEEVHSIKERLDEKCSNATMDDSDESSEEEDEEGEEEEEEEEEEEIVTTLPPPLQCDYPFTKVDEACYSFYTETADWKTWGNANAFCQTMNATLAIPSNLTAFSTYLTLYHSTAFWVGGMRGADKKFYWIGGKEFEEEDWAAGYPTKIGATQCTYLEFFSGYKAINYYCGEKFPFICQLNNP